MNQQAIDKLVNDNKRLIEAEAGKYSTNVPLVTVQIEAYKLAREAARTFDPAQGKFSTHLVNSLKKLSRISTQYGSAIRLPENTQFGINKLTKVTKDLEHTLGREPTVEELSDHTGINIKLVGNMLRSKKSNTSMTGMFNLPTMFDSTNDEWTSFVYHDLSDNDKLIFEHRTGFGGKKLLESAELAKKLRLSVPTINNRIRQMSETLALGWK